MLLRSFIAVTATLISTSVIAGDISPTDVSFGDYGEISASLTGVAGDPVAGKKYQQIVSWVTVWLVM